MLNYGAPRQLTGLIGANIGNSLSPALHDFAYLNCDIAGHYHAMDLDQLDLTADDLPRLLPLIRDIGFSGVNVTHPVKEQVIPHLDHISDTAAELGAVNTVAIRDGELTGHNTDWLGFHYALEACLPSHRGSEQSCLVLGAGGAGRAVCYALAKWGATEIRIYDRDASAADRLIESFAEIPWMPEIQLGSLDNAHSVDGIINATPIGMFGYPGCPVDIGLLEQQKWVADVVYTPVDTVLIAAARAAGLDVVTGDKMCLGQAIASFEIMTGLSPDRDAMADAFSRLLSEAEKAWADRKNA